MRHSIFKQLTEIKHAISYYPQFVYSMNNHFDLNGIPVFLYHTIDPEIFESHLLYLKKNDYQTLSVHNFYKLLTDKSEPNIGRSVLLTVDDARSSVWRFAFPLLKKYQMHATVFVIPGLTDKNKCCRKNLEDVWNGKCEIKEIYDSDPNDATLCNWQEILEMYNSSQVNIESHTLFHRETFKNFKITDFITPSTSFIPYKFPGSPYFSATNIKKKFSEYDYLGLPLFEAAPLMLAGPKLNISPEFISKCKEVYKNSMLKKTSNEDWKNEIKNIVNEPARRRKFFNMEAHSEQDVLEDLIMARELIQSKLDKNAGNHLCLPWTIGNDKTINICKELGIKSCFWGIIENKKINRSGDNPYFVSRIKNDFIFRLPGNGRKSFYSIYKYKLQRRLSGEKFF